MTPPQKESAPLSRGGIAHVSRHSAWLPGIVPILLAYGGVLALSLWLFRSGAGLTGWAVTVLWTLPTMSSAVGITGVVLTRRRLRRQRHRKPAQPVSTDKLVVVVPTIGRTDTFPALRRSVLTYGEFLPRYFPRMRVDIVTEEGCEAQDSIDALAAGDPLLRVVAVPRAYETPRGTRFKARANHYAHEIRLGEAEATDNVWVLHMDDDTGVGPDTAEQLAHFIHEQRETGPEAKHLAQGILTYPRDHAVNKLTWLADAVRPADDVTRFAVLTGGGTPRVGLHGELLLIRASVEASIGWDFGPQAIVEDAQLALNFCSQYRGRSAWISGRCYGASPATVRDFVRQRERWAWGLIQLTLNREIPLRNRLLLGYCVSTWVLGPLQHVAVVLLGGALLDDLNTSPASVWVLPLWALNMAYVVWMYWEGLRINAKASSDGRRRLWESVAVVLLIPVFSLWEGMGGFRGLLRFLRGQDNAFVVIAKPA